MGTELTVAASPPAHGTSSSLPTIAQCEERLRPCGEKTGTAELLACLTLVAPTGMSREDRAAWVAVARETLSGIPADLLKIGCAKARRTCKFASEIVPTILGEVEGAWRWRRKRLEEERQAEANRNAPRLPEPEIVSLEETKRILREAFEAVEAKKGAS